MNYNTQQIGLQNSVGNTQQNNGQPIIIQVQSGSNNFNLYPGKTAVGLGTAQIVIGGLCIVLGILLAIPVVYSISGSLGHGIWCGVMFIVAGSLTVAAGGSKSPCLVIASMVLSIIAAVCVIGIVTSSILDIIVSTYENEEYYENGIIVECIILSLGVLELIISVLSSVLACRTFDCCRQQEGTRNEQPQIVYVPNSSQASGGNNVVVMGATGPSIDMQYSDIKAPLV